MQLNGIGKEHNNSSHNVTNCLHEHSVGKKESGALRSSSLDTVSLSNQDISESEEASFSLAAWVDKKLNSGKDLLQRIWGNDLTAGTNGIEGKSLESQTLAALSDDGLAAGVGADVNEKNNYGVYGASSHQSSHASQIAAATVMVQSEVTRAVQSNPYFVTAENNKTANLWQKMKVKMKDVAGRLSGRMSGRLAGSWPQGAFQTKQEQHKEDLRRRSKYRQDELEIDCVLTDDSYLQDSYNNKGEYSKLASDMRGNISARK